MPKKPDYYAALGIPRNASTEEIRRAYLEAARRLHPDKNVSPGDTEYFLDVQSAYEVLSDPKKRATYDATLAPEKSPLSPIQTNVRFSRRSVLRIDEPQILYVLLEFSSNVQKGSFTSAPLNLSLILDQSKSMQGINMDVVKATAIQLVRRLRSQDIISIVAFSDRAETIIPSTRNDDVSRIEARIQMLQPLGGTEIFAGLEAGYNEVKRNHNPTHINHIILITDGRTYGDEQKCLDLARKAGEEGISISGLGIGHEWNDTFMDELTASTGGSSMFVNQPQGIQDSLVEKFNRLQQTYADDVKLKFQTTQGIDINYAFRLQPEAGLLSIESPLHMGPILCDSTLSILMEFLIRPETTRSDVVTLLDGTLKYSISSQPIPVPPTDFNLVRPVAASTTPEPPPREIVQALSRLILYRLQEKARLDVEAGEYESASRHLQRLSTHLLAQGELSLARTTLLEAEHIQRSKSFSKDGDKRLKYGTRALLVPGQESNET